MPGVAFSLASRPLPPLLHPSPPTASLCDRSVEVLRQCPVHCDGPSKQLGIIAIFESLSSLKHLLILHKGTADQAAVRPSGYVDMHHLAQLLEVSPQAVLVHLEADVPDKQPFAIAGDAVPVTSTSIPYRLLQTIPAVVVWLHVVALGLVACAGASGAALLLRKPHATGPCCWWLGPHVVLVPLLPRPRGATPC